MPSAQHKRLMHCQPGQMAGLLHPAPVPAPAPTLLLPCSWAAFRLLLGTGYPGITRELVAGFSGFPGPHTRWPSGGRQTSTRYAFEGRQVSVRQPSGKAPYATWWPMACPFGGINPAIQLNRQSTCYSPHFCASSPTAMAG